MRSNQLQLNADKTEVIWCTLPRRQHQIPSVPFAVGTKVVVPVPSVRDLGIHRLGSIDVDACFQDGIGMLRIAAPDSKHTSVGHLASTPVTGRSSNIVTS